MSSESSISKGTPGNPIKKIYQSKIYVPYIKRDGTALIMLSSQTSRGLGMIAMQTDNQTFSIEIMSKSNSSRNIPYSIIEKNEN